MKKHHCEQQSVNNDVRESKTLQRYVLYTKLYRALCNCEKKHAASSNICKTNNRDVFDRSGSANYRASSAVHAGPTTNASLTLMRP
jgi:hypothetical protein